MQGITSALVMDDEPQVRMMLCEFLKYSGITDIYQASSVDDAVKMFDEHSPGLVISDRNVDGARLGEELVRYVNEKSSQTPVIWFSSHAPPEGIVVAAVLGKPVGHKNFIKAIGDANEYSRRCAQLS